jgi:nucleotidyltransferase/DNA polymerase involved in DNA repair
VSLELLNELTAEFEQVRLGLPDDVPLICSQWGSIIAVNYPARAYGIKRCVPPSLS